MKEIEKNENPISPWSLKSIFSLSNKNRNSDALDSVSPKQINEIPFLSTLANSVITRCTKILGISSDELLDNFSELRNDVNKSPLRARNFLEMCSYKALDVYAKQPNYLNDKEFRRLTFDMMLAWEVPGATVETTQLPHTLEEATPTACSEQDVEDESGWSLFYSNSTKMALQVDDKKTVGLEAFARIAPACPVIADVVTVHNLFDALTASSGPRLHFLVFDKYLRSLEKVTRSVQNTVGQQLISNVSLAEDEVIIEIDGTVPTQPVLQHVGMSAWPGRLTLTNYALYFEPGVGLYDKAVRYDLATDTKQVVKPELTGPLGARLFDKAVMYKSMAIAEPVYLEFPEFKGCSRRDYWLDICLEVLRAHKFIRKYNLNEIQQSEVLARAILGILRYRAVKEVFRLSLTNYKTLLCFNLAESLPGGDMIMETLSSRISLITSTVGRRDLLSSPSSKRYQVLPVTLYSLSRLGISLFKEADMDSEGAFMGGDVYVGETNPLEDIVKQLKLNTGKAEAAQATVDQVKVEGIDTNLAVMKELLVPLTETYNRLQCLASWEYPYKSAIFVLFGSYTIIRDWVKFFIPLIFVLLALLMIWRRKANKKRQLEAFKIIAPPSKNAVEQLLTLQEAISQAETFIQSGNIILLKVRALLFAVAPQFDWSVNTAIRLLNTENVFGMDSIIEMIRKQMSRTVFLRIPELSSSRNKKNSTKYKLLLSAFRVNFIVGHELLKIPLGINAKATDRLSLVLISVGVVIALLPLKYLMLLVFVECFTNNMPLRKESTDRGVRRVREWWTRIPAAPVQLVKPDDKKRK